MPIDLASISPTARARYIGIGSDFSVPATLRQANATLAALERHAAVLAAHGFLADDVRTLREVRDAIVAARVDREAARGGKRVRRRALATAKHVATVSRERARAVLGSAFDASADADVRAAIATALEQTRVMADEPEAFAVQLDQLHAALMSPVVAPHVRPRGGAAAARALAADAPALRAADAACSQSQGTDAESEQIDLLEGIAVTLLRSARRAARSAARELGRPALAREFALAELYAARRRPRAAVAPAPAPTPPAPVPPAPA